MRRAALLVTLVCLVALTAGGAGGATQTQAQQSSAAQAQDGVDITIQLQPNGDARWNVSTSYRLQDDNDTEAFQQLAERFKAQETDDDFSVDVFRAAVPAVSESVNRSMEIRDVQRRATTIESENNTTGVLSLQFTWTSFSAVDNETLVVDSFTGRWFGNLKAGQTLTIRPPEGYDTEDVNPGPDSITGGGYEWEGAQAFATGEPRAVFTETSESDSSAGFSPVMLLGVGAGALLFGAIAVWLYSRAGLGDGSWFGDEIGESGGDEGDTDVSAETAADESEAVAATASGTATDPAASEEATSPELLSDEERVEQLLREHDGRMKQSKIVEETRWSNAKVSQLLSSMADEGRIEKLRIGRENLISLPGESVED